MTEFRWRFSNVSKSRSLRAFCAASITLRFSSTLIESPPPSAKALGTLNAPLLGSHPDSASMFPRITVALRFSGGWIQLDSRREERLLRTFLAFLRATMPRASPAVRNASQFLAVRTARSSWSERTDPSRAHNASRRSMAADQPIVYRGAALADGAGPSLRDRVSVRVRDRRIVGIRPPS